MTFHPIVKWGLLAISVLTFLIAGEFSRLAPESSPAARGAAEPGVYSCLNCHGKNDVMLPDDWSLNCGEANDVNASHPRYDAACQDLLAFFAVVRIGNSFAQRASSNSPNRLLAGEQLARQFYCFQCHGELGQGGYPNTGALKGYIPGYFGNDFRALTNDAAPDAVKTWIVESTNHELLARPIEGPIASFFMQRQSIQMPKFNRLSDSELALLADYVIALNELGPMDAATLRRYEALTRMPSLK